MLNGETVTTAGRYVQLDKVALDWPPTAPAHIIAAASGPRTLRLYGELADGSILTAPDGVRAARALIDEGRAKAGRSEPHRVIVYLLAATGPDATERVAAGQKAGFQPGAGIAGDPDAIADAVRRYGEAGADTVVLAPTSDDPDPVGFVRFVGEKVRPLLG